MLRGVGRSVLIGWVAAGAVLASEVCTSFGTDLNTFIRPSSLFPAQSADAPFSSINTGQPFLSLFQQDPSVSQSSSSSFSSGIFSFKTDTDFRDTARTEGTSFAGSFIGNSSTWQENQVGYTNLQMNLGEIVRLKTRFGASTYDPSEEFFNSIGQKKNPETQRALRFASHVGPASGAAALTRVEGLRLDDVKVTLFQEFARNRESK